MTRHQYGLSALVPQTSFRKDTSRGVEKCCCFLTLSCVMFSVSGKGGCF